MEGGRDGQFWCKGARNAAQTPRFHHRKPGMTKPYLYDASILPKDFTLPKSYVELALSQNQPDLSPWELLFLDVPRSSSYYGAMLQRYPDKPLVPFAIANDESGLFNDGYVVLACFDGNDKSGNPTIYYHDYGSDQHVHWSDRYCIPNFDEWLRVEGEESARYKASRAEDDSI
ncbi:hypothetical protein G4G28_07770 [Massilia sp. Dwa41.01b]|uniref:SMI1/KNR4 family protein n=1 Tax=unclassified Massilia TaxID=2609279 RepID=UPI0015FEDA98|nr:MULTISPECIES: SMI1/KNR4 family protein [unclassified Massilia]QNA88420.1 hypothetical protein G4G28_07770 [Massilia sp. Dwa41.01b]QNA99315.1 hypothetical protein G4G31_11455 [Massilia sp. Se16.2.3]